MRNIPKEIYWTIRSKLGTLLHKITRSYYYLKFVWKTGDFDWDYGFLEELIKMKLKWMHKYHATHSLIDDHNRVTRQLRYALRLTELLDELEYSEIGDYRLYAAKQEELIDRLFKHVRKYYRHWWE